VSSLGDSLIKGVNVHAYTFAAKLADTSFSALAHKQGETLPACHKQVEISSALDPLLGKVVQTGQI